MSDRGRSAFQIAAGLDQDGNYLDGVGEQEAKFLREALARAQALRNPEARVGEWRYRRSKLPPPQRPRKMMRVGERECRWCGGYFEPRTLRQRFCSESHRKLHHREG